MTAESVAELEPSSELPAYAIRLSMQADQDVIDATLYLIGITEDLAKVQAWKSGLLAAIRTLGTLPHRFPVVEREAKYFKLVTRQMIYRTTGSSFAYRIYYTINESGPDGPSVLILHIRHGSRKPLARAEAVEIRRNQ